MEERSREVQSVWEQRKESLEELEKVKEELEEEKRKKKKDQETPEVIPKKSPDDLVLFRALAEKLGESFESVCGMRRKERDELIEVMGITVRADTEVRLEEEREMRRSSEEKLRVAEERLLCVVCQAQEVERVFLPCGHLCCCTNCEDMIQKCPMCRAQIQGKVKAFLN